MEIISNLIDIFIGSMKLSLGFVPALYLIGALFVSALVVNVIRYFAYGRY